jgi:hypothetical protein
MMTFYPPAGPIRIDIHTNAGISVQRPQFWPFVRHLSSSATKKYRSFVGAEEPDDPGHADGPARERDREFRSTSGKNPPLASLIPAAPAGHPRPDHDRHAKRGKILERSEVRAVSRPRMHAAIRARCGFDAVHRDGPASIVAVDFQDRLVGRGRPGCRCFHPARCHLTTVRATPPKRTEIGPDPL